MVPCAFCIAVGLFHSPRMAFATMKDKKEKSKFKNEIRILAINLSKSIDGYKSEATLSKKDLKGIKIIDREEAEKMLLKPK